MLNNRKLASVLAIAGVITLALTSFAGAQISTSTTSAPSPSAHKMVLQIGPEGNALLRGTLVSVGSNSLVVSSWGGNWTINVSADTQIMPSATGNASDISNFAAGDYIGVSGKASASGVWTIDAKIVRDWSLQQTRGANAKSARHTEQAGRQSGEGRIFSGTASSVSGNSFTLTVGGAAYTVQPTSNAKILNRNWLSVSLSNIGSGDTVRVFGTANGTTITASVVRDTSLPATTTKH